MKSQNIPIVQWESASKETRFRILERSQVDLRAVESTVRDWISAVAERGDAALVEYIRKFDDPNFELKSLRVSATERERAYAEIDPELLESIREQIRISKNFHEKYADTLTKSWEIEPMPGLRVGYRRQPIDAAGLYVPAGKAPLPTVAQILTVAAKAAGVPRTVVCFPPTDRHAAIIVAASEAGADEIYRVGGIAAIAALALGTETIRPVQKIAGPGNSFVQAAKLQLVERVGIDMLSGPSEIAIIADETANAAFIASDILAQCEHGADSVGVVATTSESLAREIASEVEKQRAGAARMEYLSESLSRYSAIILFEDQDSLVDFINDYSPEHLEIQTKNPREVFEQIRNAGSTFLGPYAPVAVGDYASGTNHCLPTGVAARFSSPVSPETFMKCLQYQELTDGALRSLQPIVERISDAEGLPAHKRSVQLRFEGR